MGEPGKSNGLLAGGSDTQFTVLPHGTPMKGEYPANPPSSGEVGSIVDRSDVELVSDFTAPSTWFCDATNSQQAAH
jgi:hypothetical protein